MNRTPGNLMRENFPEHGEVYFRILKKNLMKNCGFYVIR